jgi:hypothetical protein
MRTPVGHRRAAAGAPNGPAEFSKAQEVNLIWPRF